MFLEENIGFRYMTFSDLNLTLGQLWKWVSPSNFTSQITHKSCVTRHSCYIFIWRPHLTWPCPWPVLSLLFTWQLRHPFSSVFAEFALAAVSGLVSAADKAKRVSFDIWPDLNPTFDLARKFWDCIRIPSLRAYDHCLALLAPPITSEFRQGAIYPPPQPTEVGWRPQLCAG